MAAERAPTVLAPVVVCGAAVGAADVAVTEGATVTDPATAAGAVASARWPADPRDGVSLAELEPVPAGAAPEVVVGCEARGPADRAGPGFDDELDPADPCVSALATAGNAAMPTPTPNAMANAPTRPTYRA